LWFPIRWIGSQILYLLPLILLFSVLYPAGRTSRPKFDFNQRFVTVIACGPFIITTVGALLSGRLPVPLWGYPFWTFLPLAFFLLSDSLADISSLRRFAAAFLIMFVSMPVAFVLNDFIRFRERSRASEFPGQELAERVTSIWRQQTGTPLFYVSGADIGSTAGPGEIAANSVSVFSPDRPHVIARGNLRLSPWIDPIDLNKRGAALVWETYEAYPDLRPDLRVNFPTAELQPPIILPIRTRHRTTNAFIGFAIVPPQK
jgi:hypothetical protein